MMMMIEGPIIVRLTPKEQIQIQPIEYLNLKIIFFKKTFTQFP